MYTEKDRDSNLRKRGFKFVNKSGMTLKRALVSKGEAAQTEEASEIEKADFPWPRELMAIMS